AAAGAPRERAGAEPFLELSSGAVLLFVNAAQAKVLTGREDPEQAARVLTAWYPHVAVKMAADGALFYANGRPPVRVPAPPVDRVVDGTGAGDAFIAGFLPAWLDKKPPGEALAGGCRLAAHALGLVGARPVLSGPFPERSTPVPFLDDLFSLDRRVAVVTGGSSGIGAAMAAALARAGARVVLVARDAERLARAAASVRTCGAEVAWVSADLAERPAVAQAADEA